MILDLHRGCITINNFNTTGTRYIERKECVEKIKTCKQKLSELKIYENIMKIKNMQKINKFLKI
jgi:hypothetical protein